MLGRRQAPNCSILNRSLNSQSMACVGLDRVTVQLSPLAKKSAVKYRERSGAARLHRLGCARQLEAGDTFVQNGPDARTVQLDATNAASIAQAAETRIQETCGRLDVHGGDRARLNA
ncbi:hypothetical protein AMC87_PC00335 (plasmid) [Rhizobium phaseoli]|nr:hypothetical conserved protein [Rhizobium etli CIAT 652]ANL50029.1 hypothetical protein AMC87_PC00335 [Rhizobium phaseoli]ARM91416.1 hypothetical protein RHEC894_PC00393 [Rhizobium sp. CIAT894]KKZ84422.1 hypothetical protein RPHASCH2410_PC00370 [Rhizobium phaseoli Ch24-10]